MTQTSINYATVLYELEIPTEVINETKEIFCKTDELYKSLISPVVSKDSKDSIIEKVFPKEIHNFLKVLCHYNSMNYIYEIFDEYKAIVYEKNGILPATLEYVEQPDDRQKKGIENYLCKMFGKDKVELECVHRPELIGGFVIKAGGFVIDRSVLGKIQQLQLKLVKR